MINALKEPLENALMFKRNFKMQCHVIQVFQNCIRKSSVLTCYLDPAGDVIHQVIFLSLKKIQACIQFMGQKLTKRINFTLLEVNFTFTQAVSL